MKYIWKKWLLISRKLVSVQAAIVLTICYVLLILPLSLLLQILFKKVLLGHGYQKRNNSYWIKHNATRQDIHFAQEQ